MGGCGQIRSAQPSECVDQGYVSLDPSPSFHVKGPVALFQLLCIVLSRVPYF